MLYIHNPMTQCFIYYGPFYSCTVPKLEYLQVTALENNTLAIEWRIQYSGGSPITRLVIRVEALHLEEIRQEQRAILINLSPNEAATGYYVTEQVEEGFVYLVTVQVENEFGVGDHQTKGNRLNTDIRFEDNNVDKHII